MSFAHELPFALGSEEFCNRSARAAIWVGFYGLWPIAPEPVQGVGEYLAGMFLIVAAVAEGVIDVVSGKLKRTEHRLVGEPPIAAL